MLVSNPVPVLPTCSEERTSPKAELLEYVLLTFNSALPPGGRIWPSSVWLACVPLPWTKVSERAVCPSVCQSVFVKAKLGHVPVRTNVITSVRQIEGVSLMLARLRNSRVNLIVLLVEPSSTVYVIYGVVKLLLSNWSRV